jgi:HTH-type transcriptional regulator/antitoxin HipB
MRSTAITDPETLGLVLREARERCGLTQRQLAEQMDVRQSYIAELEAGKSVKALERLLDFAQATGVTLRAEFDAPTGTANHG